MTTRTPDPIVVDYLKRLRGHARGLPRARRDELMLQIEDRLDYELPPGATEAEIRIALARLGDPHAIVAHELEHVPAPRPRAGKLELAVVILLPIGTLLIPLLGWIVGVGLLWYSRTWRLIEKLIGTLLPPGGLSSVLLIALLFGSIGWAVLLAFVIAGVATPIYLGAIAIASRRDA